MLFSHELCDLNLKTTFYFVVEDELMFNFDSGYVTVSCTDLLSRVQELNPEPSVRCNKLLASTLGFDVGRVYRWFYYRRIKGCKKKKEIDSTEEECE